MSAPGPAPTARSTPDVDPLRPRHRRQLEVESAIPADVLAEEGVVSLADGRGLPTPDEAFRHPNPEKGTRFGTWPKTLGPGVLFPIPDAEGRLTYHYRPDRPRDRDGKPVKYEACAGTRLALHVPARVRPLLRRRDVPLWFTEGAKKVLAGVGRGLGIIGLMGVDGWVVNKGDGTSEPLPDWDAIALDGRLVFVAFDSDVTTKPEVKGALDRLCRFLRGRGATVVIVRIPHGEDGRKVGLDDYLAAGGSIDALVTDALVAALNGAGGGTDGAQACARCPALTAENAELRAEVGRLRERDAGRKALLSSEAWSGKQRQVVELIVDKIQQARAEGRAEVSLYYPVDGKRSGTSTATVSAVVGRLRDFQAAHPDTPLPFRIQDGERPNGHPRVSLVGIDPASHPGRDLNFLARIPRPENLAKHGGARRRCPDHPRADVVLRTRRTWHCSECDRLLDEAEETRREPPFHHEMGSPGRDEGATGPPVPRSGLPSSVKGRQSRTGSAPPFHHETVDGLDELTLARRAREALDIPPFRAPDKWKTIASPAPEPVNGHAEPAGALQPVNQNGTNGHARAKPPPWRCPCGSLERGPRPSDGVIVCDGCMEVVATATPGERATPGARGERDRC